MRIARNLSNIRLEETAQYFDLEPQSLRRLEAKSDRDKFSIKVFIMVVMIYNQEANFYFSSWKNNEILLQKK